MDEDERFQEKLGSSNCIPAKVKLSLALEFKLYGAEAEKLWHKRMRELRAINNQVKYLLVIANIC